MWTEKVRYNRASCLHILYYRGKNDENITRHTTGNEDITNESLKTKKKKGVTVTLQTSSTDTPTYTDPSVADTTKYLSAFREEAETRRKKI